MNWLYLSIAIVFEVCVGLTAGKADGFRCLRWTIATLVSGAFSTYFLGLALLTFDVGIGYALWTALAEIGIVTVSTLFLSQSLTWKKAIGVATILTGVVGLNLAGAH